MAEVLAANQCPVNPVSKAVKAAAFSPALVTCALVAWLWCLPSAIHAQADPFLKARPDFQNQLFLATPTNAPGTSLAQPASDALFSGSVGDATNLNNAAPNDGQIFLAQAQIGTSVSGPPTLPFAPVIATQPRSNSVVYGDRAVLTVLAAGTPPFSYQWLRNGSVIPGATGGYFVIGSAQFTDATSYSVVISNASGVVTSSVAGLTVTLPQTGEVDYSFNPGSSMNAIAKAVAIGADGEVTVGGVFTVAHGVARKYLARYHADGSPALEFMNGLSGPDSEVYALALQEDGRVLAGGRFTAVNGSNRSRIARLNSDGTLDTSFLNGLSGPNSDVLAIAVQLDGGILIAGRFTNANGTARGRIARLNADGTLDAGFQAGLSGADAAVNAVALQTDGKILLGGSFSNVNGVARSRLARLNADGSLDSTFQNGLSGSDAEVFGLTVQSDGKIVVGGAFLSVNGLARNHLARLNPDGTVDSTFLNGLSGTDSDVYTVAMTSGGGVLVGGEFSTVNGVPRTRLARLDQSGNVDSGFQNGLTNQTSSVTCLGVRSDGQAIVGGLFAVRQGSIGRLALLATNGALALLYGKDSSGVNDWATSLAIQNDGKILLAGSFSSLYEVPANCVARFNTDGSRDTNFLSGQLGVSSGVASSVEAVALQPDGKALIGGEFASFNGTARNRIARLNPGGAVDSSFQNGLSGADNLVTALALENGGKVVIAGRFTNVNGVARNRVARLNANGTLDGAFLNGLSGADSEVAAIALQVDGRILLGGSFSNVNGVARSGLARLNSDGTLDTGFQAGLSGANDKVSCLAVQNDGRIIAGGRFTNMNGTARSRLARLNADGSLDTGFLNGLSGAEAEVRAVAIESSGRVLVGGDFQNFNGALRRFMTRINADGSLDNSFQNAMSGVVGQVEAVAVQSDGQIVIGGLFYKVNSAARGSIARLHAYPFSAPSVVAQPQSQVVAASSNITLNVMASGTGPLYYQWFRNGVLLAGATNASYTANNVQPGNGNNFFFVVSNSLGSITSQVATLTVETTFTRIMAGGIATDTGQFEGVASGDFDGDGLPDLFVANYSGTNVLYRNLGNGSFNRLTNGVIASDPASRQSYAGSWGDYDNDGNLDLIVANNNGQNSLYRNVGGGNFTAITNSVMASEPGNAGSRTAIWGDYDNDGWLDCFVANGGGTAVNFLYRNNRDGTFTKILTGDPTVNGAGSFGAAWGDYDNDGRLDLFVSNQTGASGNLLYHNEGGGVLTRIIAGPGAPATIDSRGCAWGDYDNDGYLDLIVANKTLAPNTLYHNDGHGGFTSVNSGPIGTDMSHSVGVAWGDYDNDGWLDLFVANEGENNFLYHNNGDGTFTRVTSGALVNDGGLSRSATWADANNDGFLDLFVSNIGPAASANFFYINNGNSNSWLKVNLVGRTSNRSAIGAKIRAQAVIGGVSRWQLREVSGGGYGQNSLAQSFGLGDATNIDVLRIEWPSGVVQTLSNVAPRQVLTITETAPPVIDFQPTNQIVTASSNVTLSVQARGSTPLLFQWFRSGIAIIGATNATFTLSNAQPANAGSYTVIASNAFGSVTSQVATLTVETTFSKVTTGALANAKMYAVAWGDYDNDGWPDLSALMLPQFSGDAVLYHNTNGVFTTVTNSQWAAEGAPDYGITWGDYDNDGLTDLFVSSSSGGSGRLYHNNGNGVFTRVPAWGGESDAENSGHCSWVDYDRDGYLDLFVANGFNGISANLLYHNNRNGTFTRVLAGSIATDVVNSDCGVWGDYDNDGWPDLFVSNYNDVSFLYHNNGNGTFTRVSIGSIASSGSWVDYDNDGYLDLFVAVTAGQGSRLYHNNQNGTFTRITSPVETVGNSVNGAWGDYDNDGNVDLFIPNYYGDPRGNFLYLNNGTGNFTKVTNNVIAGEGGDSYGAAWADYNRDGFLDLVVGNGGGGNAFVYRNSGSSNSWLSVRCRGTASNRDAIGAKVRVTATINGSSCTQMREITSASGYASQNEPAQHFGLGDATNIDVLRIEWPSGIAQTFSNVAPRQFLTIQEQTTLYFAVNGSGSVSYSPVRSNYFIGEPITLTATPRNPNWTRFLRWSDGNTNAARSYSVGLTNALTAIFTNTVPLETMVLKEWEQDFGGSGDEGVGNAMLATDDGGFLVAGWSSSGATGNKVTDTFGGNDFWLLKLAGDGTKMWERTYGGAGNDDNVHGLVRTADGGFIIGGRTDPTGGGNKTAPPLGNTDVWLVKVDANGTKIWDHTYGGSGNELLLSLAPTSDGGFVVGARSDSSVSGNKTTGNFGGFDYWIFKVDQNGAKQWEQLFGTTGDDFFDGLISTRDGGFLLMGAALTGQSGNKTVTGFGNYDSWIIKLDRDGRQQWQRVDGGNVDDTPWHACLLDDGTIAVVGNSTSSGGGNRTVEGFGLNDGWVFKLTADNQRIWERGYGGSQYESLNVVRQSSDGGLLVGGDSESGLTGNKLVATAGLSDGWFKKLNADGSPVWEYNLGGTGADYMSYFLQFGTESILAGLTSSSGISGNKGLGNSGGSDIWLVALAAHEQPIGTPIVLVNGLYAISNTFFIPATNAISVTLTSSIPSNVLRYRLNGSDAIDYDGTPFPLNATTVIEVSAVDDFENEIPADPVTITVVPVYSLAASTDGGGNVVLDPPGGAYLSNSVVTVTAMPSAGWTFLQWTGDVVSTSATILVTNDRARSLQAVFGAPVVTGVSPAANNPGYILRQPDLAFYPFGKRVRLTGVPTNSTRYFSRWTNALTTTLDPDYIFVTNSSMTATGIFASLSGQNRALTVIIQGNGGVTNSPQQPNYANNASVTLTASPDAGNVFTGWSGDTNSALNPLTVVMNTNKTVTANFTVPPNIAITSPTNGSVLSGPTVTVSADASDSDGSVTRVDLYADGNLVGTNATPPFSFNWPPTAEGAHTLTARAFDNAGSVSTSATVSVSVLLAPRIVVQLRSQAIYAGANPVLSVAPEGHGPLSYQWRLQGTNLPGETNFALFLLDVRTNQSGSYSVAVTNNVGAVTSLVASLVVTQLPPTRLVAWGNVTGLGVPMVAPPLQGLKAISCGDYHGMGLRPDGTIALWGAISNVPVKATNIVVVESGGVDGTQNLRTIALRSDGVPVWWQTDGSEVPAMPPGISNVSAVAAGNSHAVIVHRDGTVQVWDPWNNALLPGPISNVIAVAAGTGTFTVALKNDTTVVAWGYNASGQTNVPSGLSNVIAVAAGGYHGVALKGDGTVVTWGDNAKGQCSVPAAATNIVAIAAGLEQTLAINASGTLFAWGDNGGSAVQLPGNLGPVLATDGGWGWGAALVISTPTQPPVVAITSPAIGATFTAPASIALAASANDADGSVTQVAFFAGATLLSRVTNAPFNFTWTGVNAGNYSLTAVATDNGGLSATSSNVSITVTTAVPVVDLTSPPNNSSFLAPASIPLRAVVSDADTSVAWVDFFSGATLIGSVTNPPSQPTHQLTWSNVSVGNYSISALAHDLFGPVVASGTNNITVSSVNTNPPVFSWSNATVNVSEAAGSVTIYVFKSADSTQVPADIGFHAQSASADTADFTPPGFSQLSFAVGETVKPITIGITQDSLVESNHFFFMVLDLISGSISGPAEAQITILDDDVATTNSFLTRVAPSTLPSPLAALRVDLQPTNVGQWRFSWENSWRDGGTPVTGLPPGNYELQFKPVSGYVEPLSTYVPVITNTLNAFTFVYSNTTAPQLGSLAVFINPSFVATNGDPNQHGQWRVGQGAWHNSGETIDALPADVVRIEFKPLTAGSWQTPSVQDVTILPNQLNSAVGEYFVANSTPGTGPTVVSNNQVQITFGLQRGYQFCGQLLTPLGWGSGTVVKQGVVLTAAHVIFDDYALEYVPPGAVKWFFQRQAGEYEPAPQTPRGFVKLDGYAAQRQAEASPGLSGTASRDLDIAALYFNEAAGRGGFSGYLVSRPGEEWLQIATSASLAGYPVEGVPTQDRGKMHRTVEQPVTWSVVSNQVFASTDLKSYPGNSGGPILVQVTAIIPPDSRVNYWPAAVYLGGSGNTVVRAIDDLAVGLINTAEVLGNAGGSYIGGEPPAQPCGTCPPPAQYAYLDVYLTPTNIGTLGGGYRFANVTNSMVHRDAYARYQVLGNTEYTLTFLGAPQHIAPQAVTANVPTGRTNSIFVSYKPWGRMQALGGGAFQLNGSTGTVYRIESSPRLGANAVWTTVRSVTNNAASMVVNLPTSPTNIFFRAVLVP